MFSDVRQSVCSYLGRGERTSNVIGGGGGVTVWPLLAISQGFYVNTQWPAAEREAKRGSEEDRKEREGRKDIKAFRREGKICTRGKGGPRKKYNRESKDITRVRVSHTLFDARQKHRLSLTAHCGKFTTSFSLGTDLPSDALLPLLPKYGLFRFFRWLLCGNVDADVSMMPVPPPKRPINRGSTALQFPKSVPERETEQLG